LGHFGDPRKRPDAGSRLAIRSYEPVNFRFSVGIDLTETVRAAILQIPNDAWVCALDQEGSERPNGQVPEITGATEACQGNVVFGPCAIHLLSRRHAVRNRSSAYVKVSAIAFPRRCD